LKNPTKCPVLGLPCFWWRFSAKVRGLETATHHRAYSDALSAAKVMEKSFENLPGYVKTMDFVRLIGKRFKNGTSSGRQMAGRAYDVAWTFALALDSVERSLETTGAFLI